MYSFDQVIGHEYIIRSMRNSLKANRISHAYIIDGSSGSGKKLLAKSFVKSILCEESADEPCGFCPSCKSFENSNNPDFIYISRAKSIGVDDIRDSVTSTINIKPYKYNRKIYMIDKADTMTLAAQNALLKTIEEPVSHAVLILISSNMDNFLPTVVSRCVRYKLKPVNIADIRKHLMVRGYPQNDAEAASVYSGGSVGAALNFLEDDGMKSLHEKVSILVDKIDNEELSKVLLLINEFEAIKERIGELLDFMYLWYRDVLVYAETRNENTILLKSGLPKIAKLVEKNTKDSLFFRKNLFIKSLFIKLEAILEAKQQLTKYANFQMVVEMMLLKMKTEEI